MQHAATPPRLFITTSCPDALAVSLRRGHHGRRRRPRDASRWCALRCRRSASACDRRHRRQEPNGRAAPCSAYNIIRIIICTRVCLPHYPEGYVQHTAHRGVGCVCRGSDEPRHVALWCTSSLRKSACVENLLLTFIGRLQNIKLLDHELFLAVVLLQQGPAVRSSL
jgi:hypothetical protein